jgi:peroxiredoxin
MNNVHRGIRIPHLQVRSRAISSEPALQFCTWGSRVRLLRIAHNLILACLHYNGNHKKGQCKYLPHLTERNVPINRLEILMGGCYKGTIREETMIIRRIFLFFLFGLILFASSISADTKKEDLFSKAGIQPVKSGKRAPNFVLEDLTGKKTELRHYRGKLVFLNFWATWCGPCKEEMPSMEELWKQFKDKDFVFLAVSVDYAGAKPAKEFIEKHRYTFPVLADPKCETLDLFQVTRIPTTLVIDKKGMIIGKAVGPHDWKRPEVVSVINLLLKK